MNCIRHTYLTVWRDRIVSENLQLAKTISMENPAQKARISYVYTRALLPYPVTSERRRRRVGRWDRNSAEDYVRREMKRERERGFSGNRFPFPKRAVSSGWYVGYACLTCTGCSETIRNEGLLSKVVWFWDAYKELCFSFSVWRMFEFFFWFKNRGLE